jgi:hypothetical protein
MIMVASAAWWGLGYAALLVAAVVYGWRATRPYLTHVDNRSGIESRAIAWIGQALLAVSTILLWAGLWNRAARGHGWPLVTSADAASGVALLLLLLYTCWSLLSGKQDAGLAVAVTAAGLLTYGLGRFSQAWIADSLISKASVLSSALNVCAASLLALAAAIGTTDAVLAWHRPAPQDEPGAKPRAEERTSEMLVRITLVCLAASLAIDTWWLQKVGLGGDGDAQQAGIAIAWMVYFFALRLRSSPRWRGWPWASLLAVGFVCTLPILLNVPWLDNTLPL